MRLGVLLLGIEKSIGVIHVFLDMFIHSGALKPAIRVANNDIPGDLALADHGLLSPEQRPCGKDAQHSQGHPACLTHLSQLD